MQADRLICSFMLIGADVRRIRRCGDDLVIEAACLKATQRLRLELILHWHRLLRFSLVGVSGLIVNNAVLFWQVEVLRWRPVPGAIVATECAIFSNFVLNDRWTFADSPKAASWLRRLVSYNALTLGGLVLSVAVLAAFHYGVRLHYQLPT